jgi:predicted alpha/beta superfamily hydrolase
MAQSGTLVSIRDFESKHVNCRNVDVWLPDSYKNEAVAGYPVIYMHDGQNLFEDSTSAFGISWGVDETLARLSSEGKIPECIVVGIWNTPLRYPEYQPEKPYQHLDADFREKLTDLYGQEPLSDCYLKFITEELKPYIDQNYRTSPGRESTCIMGSSMGGLISVYALSEYPGVFGAAGCLSTHWVTRVDLENGEMARVMKEYLEQNLPEAGQHRIYFDFGTAGLDEYYEIHQEKIDEVMMSKGYNRGKDWVTLKFDGEDHNELSWNRRLHIPVEFLLKK